MTHFFQEEIFQKYRYALVDYKYLSYFRNFKKENKFTYTNKTHELFEKNKKEKDKIKKPKETVTNVFLNNLDCIHIIQKLLCELNFLRKVWQIREVLNIPTLNSFYISENQYDEQRYIEWKNNADSKEVSKLLNKIKDAVDIPSFWMIFVENFILKGVYLFPKYLKFPKKKKEKTNYMVSLMSGMQYKDALKTDAFYQPKIVSSYKNSLSRSRYAISCNHDGSYSIEVFPGLTREQDLKTAFEEIRRSSWLDEFPKRDKRLEVFSLVLHLLSDTDAKFTEEFRNEYKDAFDKDDKDIESKNGEFHNLSKEARNFLK